MLGGSSQSSGCRSRHSIHPEGNQRIFRGQHLALGRGVAPDPDREDNPRQEGQDPERLQPSRYRPRKISRSRPRRGQPPCAQCGEHRHDRKVQAVVENHVRADGGKGSQGSRGQPQLHTLRQEPVGRRRPRQTEHIAPARGKVDKEKARTEDQADPSIFNEQLQPIAVGMNGVRGKAHPAVTTGQILERVCSRAEDRIKRQHGRHGDGPQILPVFVHRQLVESEPNGQAFISGGHP